MSEPRMVKVMNAAELNAGEAKVVRIEEKQIALFRVGTDTICAIDNRCPHEGYPLVQGTVADCVLTCDWHNWKFNLEDGRCLRGGEDVRSYPVKVENGDVLLDISEPPNAAAIPKFIESLRQGMAEMDDSRAARDVVRLLKLGADEKEIIAEIARFGGEHDGEANDLHGFDHGMAVLADCVRVRHLYEGYERVIPLAQGLSAVAEPRLRQGVRRPPAPVDITKFGTMENAFAEFRRFVEAEDHEQSEAILRGALAAGASATEMQRWIFTIVTDHFLSYGHRMIYAVKAFQLLEVIGWQHAIEILPCLVVATVLGTREDRLPYMRRFQTRLKAIEATLPELFARQQTAGAELDEAAFRHALLDGSIDEAFTAVDEALKAGVPMAHIAYAIVLAASERCLRFNIAVDRDRKIEEGWLDVTHALTHASAVREALAMSPSPELLRGLYQGARLVQYTRQPGHTLLDLPRERRDRVCDPALKFDWREFATHSDDELRARLADEIAERQHAAAMRTTRAYLELHRPADQLTTMLIKYALADSEPVAIVLAHAIKNTIAAVEEFNARPDHPHRWLPILAAVRFLASPKNQRWTYYGTIQAIDFIANAQAKE